MLLFSGFGLTVFDDDRSGQSLFECCFQRVYLMDRYPAGNMGQTAAAAQRRSELTQAGSCQQCPGCLIQPVIISFGFLFYLPVQMALLLQDPVFLFPEMVCHLAGMV